MEEKEPVPRCRCGHDQDHHMVSAEADYSPLGWLTVLIGISTRPIRIRWVCRRCGEQIAWSTEPEVLNRHI